MTKENEDWQALMDEHYSASHDNGYIGRQYRQENQSTTALFKFISESVLNDSSERMLDAGCGDGAMLHSARKYFPNARLFGFDLAKDMLRYAKDNLPDDIKVGHGDLFDIAAFDSDPFDTIYSVHTLPLFESFEKLTLSLMQSAKRHVFINSLFSTHNVDMIARVKDEGFPEIVWSIFSIKRFRQFAMDNGAKHVEFRPFNISIDLPDPGEGMGSHTRLMENGERLTFSGPLYLPWHLVRIDMGN